MIWKSREKLFNFFYVNAIKILLAQVLCDHTDIAERETKDTKLYFLAVYFCIML